MQSFVSAILCFSNLVGIGLGLHNGMVVCFDDHGHVAFEAAHVEHAHRHAEGEDHGHEDFGIDPDHEFLHDAIASCFDVRVGTVRPHSVRAHELRFDGPTAVASSITAAADLDLPRVPAMGSTCHFWGSTARAELACLSGIILLV